MEKKILVFILIILSLDLVASIQDQLFISFAMGPNNNTEELSTTKEAGCILLKNKMYFSLFYSSQYKFELMEDNDKPHDKRYEVGFSTGIAFRSKRTASSIITLGGGINYYSQKIYKPTSEYMVYDLERANGIGVQLKLIMLKKLYKYLGLVMQTNATIDPKQNIISAQIGFCIGNFNVIKSK